MSGNDRSGLRLASGEMNQILNSVGNSSGPSVGASSLVTDANSGLSGGPQLQKSTSFNNESYMGLPASPISFSSNFSGSSVMDGCSIVQQSSLQEQVQKQGLSTATSQLVQQEPNNLMNAQKKPRLGVKHEDVLQQQLIQQLLQRHDGMHPQVQQNPQLQTILQQQRLLQRQQHQQQIMQSLSQMQQGPITLQQQQQLRHHLQPQSIQSATLVKRPLDNGICSRRLMQYLYHQRHRSPDNSILYWRKFVAEYFAVRARKRWCLSLYDNMANNTLGVFPQLAVDAWQCGFCGSKSGKGFEATFEVLPRLFQIKFDHGVIDENLFLDMPHESRLSSGIMVLEYEKAVQESVYEHLHIVREGQLRIIFTPELKILLWEFCTQRHEEFLPRRLLASQVNQLLQVAQKYQATVTENNTAGVSHQDLQASCNMFAAIGRQLARNFDLQSLNDLGFSKRYVRCLQISEVVSSMKDLIDFSQEQKIGAIESLKNYPRHAAAKLQKQKLDEEQVMSSHTLPGDPTTLKKATGIQAGLNNYINNNLAASQVANSSQQGVHALNSFQNMLRNTLNLKQNVLQEEALSSLSGSNHAQPLQFQGSASSVSIDASVSNLSGQHRPQPPLDIRLQQQYNPQNPQVNQHMQQHVIQQMLQEMMNNNKGASQQSVIAPNANAGLAAGDVTGGDITGTPVRIDTGSIRNALELQSMPTNLCNNGTGGMGSRSYSFQSAATASNPTISGNIINSRPDLPQNMGLPEMDHIAQEFAKMGYSMRILGDVGFFLNDWKE
ncbi:Transcriptional corepressor SEUSS [Musa troglodytarum]|uniref:Transcriptional corepressor SEUSS n=1 Tax=Musa troglodytarum TaxID=320322 RepID=A0A9E7IAI1_9LILI|nr:Transcriptional corepressor SEUSS [Musa troglodytarum]